MIHRQMEAWKKFIRGRIAQEQGREEEALRGFEQAIEIDPNNKYFREASEVAKRNLSRNLSRSDEDHLLHVQACYEQIARTITSQNERVEGFKEMLAELEGRPPIDGYVRTYKGGLHSGWNRSSRMPSVGQDDIAAHAD